MTIDAIIKVLSEEGDHPLARDLALGLHPFPPKEPMVAFSGRGQS
jgi:hypothetical protein